MWYHQNPDGHITCTRVLEVLQQLYSDLWLFKIPVLSYIYMEKHRAIQVHFDDVAVLSDKP